MSELRSATLAIELAAARVKALSVEQIAARLDDRFRLLTGTGRGTLPHHQTLKASLDWSHSLLTEGERMLLRRLAVFAGGFDLEAAEAACADHLLSAADVLDFLTRLVDRSLVLFEEHDAGGRYRLLETVRQYALDRLLEAGEHDTWRSRHQNYYEAWSEALRQTVEEAEGSGTEIHLAAFALEHDNLRAALQWSWTSHQPTVTLRLAAATSAFWDRTDYISEGRRWLEAGITGAGESAPADLRARAYYFAGALAWHQGEYGQARAYLERSLSLSRTLEARPGPG